MPHEDANIGISIYIKIDNAHDSVQEFHPFLIISFQPLSDGKSLLEIFSSDLVVLICFCSLGQFIRQVVHLKVIRPDV